MRRILGLGILLVGTIVVYKAITKGFKPDLSRVTSDNYARIHIGMSEREVQSILGSPAGTTWGASGKDIGFTRWLGGKMSFVIEEGVDPSEPTEINQWILEAVGAYPFETKWRSRTEQTHGLKGRGALWEGLDWSRISVVFEDGEVIYKSYYRRASDPPVEEDPADPGEQQPQDSASARP